MMPWRGVSAAPQVATSTSARHTCFKAPGLPLWCWHSQLRGLLLPAASTTSGVITPQTITIT